MTDTVYFFSIIIIFLESWKLGKKLNFPVQEKKKKVKLTCKVLVLLGSGGWIENMSCVYVQDSMPGGK